MKMKMYRNIYMNMYIYRNMNIIIRIDIGGYIILNRYKFINNR